MHVGYCHAAGKRRRVIDRDQARALLADGICTCAHCRPDTGLGVFGYRQALFRFRAAAFFPVASAWGPSSVASPLGLWRARHHPRQSARATPALRRGNHSTEGDLRLAVTDWRPRDCPYVETRTTGTETWHVRCERSITESPRAVEMIQSPSLNHTRNTYSSQEDSEELKSWAKEGSSIKTSILDYRTKSGILNSSRSARTGIRHPIALARAARPLLPHRSKKPNRRHDRFRYRSTSTGHHANRSLRDPLPRHDYAWDLAT
ncbi:DUF6233 domain-containing protein [Streptomyces sp. NPDC005134]|uniref:DUF6233 domain-containing protein n=1 Tax=Streptomyces sp. NPDC005098 TaxID=3154560 RepID=UPI0033A2335E